MNSPDSLPESSTNIEMAVGTAGNTVATIGLILTLLAGLLCVLLFVAASQLPEPNDLPGSADETSEDVDSDAGIDQDPTEPVVSLPDLEMNAHAEVAKAALEAQRLQVLLLGIATFVLNLTGLVLCVIGLFVPSRTRVVAICGTILSLLLLAGVFGVISVGALLNPMITASG
ncbi:MAG: hypothetical protein MK102_09135 [Fuerstiella sp.]|nr:hypothetical protein [Fuerstiella sp.]